MNEIRDAALHLVIQKYLENQKRRIRYDPRAAAVTRLAIAAGKRYQNTLRMAAMRAELAHQASQTIPHHAYAGNIRAVNAALKSGAHVDYTSNANDWTPLQIAVHRGHVNLVSRLIAAGANHRARDSKEQTPLHLAARGSHASVALVNALLAAGANHGARDARGRTPLHVAIQGDHTAVVKALLAGGASHKAVDALGQSPLKLAIQQRKEAASNALIDAGANVREKGLMHAAAYASSPELVQRLLNAGANARAVDDGLTPLHVAASLGRSTVARHLLNAGANVNAVDEDGLTPLHKAARHRQTAGVQQLLNAGANINAVDKEGLTPLHYAVRGGKKESVQQLLKAGANDQAVTKNGRSVMDFAREYAPHMIK